jgi:ElaB/YqjD/DUF883 family membrane-anchored ribosome-binding protein
MSTDVKATCEGIAGRAAAVAADFEEVRSAANRLAEDSVDAVRQTASDFVAEGRSQVRGARHGIERAICERPVKIVLLAAAAGFVLGVFWRRR